MTATELQICKALGNVRYLAGSFDKRFGNNVSHYGPEKELSVSQKEWIMDLQNTL
jgi:hypothetical protein